MIKTCIIQYISVHLETSSSWHCHRYDSAPTKEEKRYFSGAWGDNKKWLFLKTRYVHNACSLIHQKRRTLKTFYTKEIQFVLLGMN